MATSVAAAVATGAAVWATPGLQSTGAVVHAVVAVAASLLAFRISQVLRAGGAALFLSGRAVPGAGAPILGPTGETPPVGSVIGRVSEIRSHAVKSCAPTLVAAARVDCAGLQRDRRYVVYAPAASQDGNGPAGGRAVTLRQVPPLALVHAEVATDATGREVLALSCDGVESCLVVLRPPPRCDAATRETPTRSGKLALADCINAECPFSGKPVAEDSLTLHEGWVVGFCNPSCRDDFARAPVEFPEAIRAFSQHTVVALSEAVAAADPVDAATAETTHIKLSSTSSPSPCVDCGDAAAAFLDAVMVEAERRHPTKRGCRTGLRVARVCDWSSARFVRDVPILGRLGGAEDRTVGADLSPLLLANESSSQSLADAMPKEAREAASLARFRPNIAVGEMQPWLEDRLLRIEIVRPGAAAGTGLELRSIMACPRCILPTIDPVTGTAGKPLAGQRAPEPLASLRRLRAGGAKEGWVGLVSSGAGPKGLSPLFGIYCAPRGPTINNQSAHTTIVGELRVGDEVRVLEYRPPLNLLLRVATFALAVFGLTL